MHRKHTTARVGHVVEDGRGPIYRGEARRGHRYGLSRGLAALSLAGLGPDNNAATSTVRAYVSNTGFWNPPSSHHMGNQPTNPLVEDSLHKRGTLICTQNF